MPRPDLLSNEARALILQCILAGETNKQINVSLRAANLIDPNRTVSDNALTPYRQSDEVRVQARRLSSEAIQVGHAALSHAILANMRILRATEEVLVVNGKIPAEPNARHTLAEKMFFKASKFLWDTLWQTGLPESIKDEERLAELAKRVEHMDTLPDGQRQMIVLEVRETLNRLLTDMVAARKAQAENAPHLARTVSLVAIEPTPLGGSGAVRATEGDK